MFRTYKNIALNTISVRTPVFERLQSKPVTGSPHNSDYKHTDTIQVENLLQNINTSKPCGHDTTTPQLLKDLWYLVH